MKRSSGPSAPVAEWRTLAPATLLLAGAVVYGVMVGGGSLRFSHAPRRPTSRSRRPQPEDHRVDDVADAVERAEKAIGLFGAERILLNPDCGFATLADIPIVSAEVAEAKLAVLTQARDLLRDRHGI